MAINIRRERTLEAARRLAAISGEPMVTEIEIAVLERLERVERESQERVDYVFQVVGEVTPQLKPEFWAKVDPSEDLYDENGLPR